MDHEACVNVLAGLTADGLTRLEEAKQFADERAAAGDPAPLAAYPDLARRVAEDSVPCDCGECERWDGLDRRCYCGNRRVAWGWSGCWYAEVY